MSQPRPGDEIAPTSYRKLPVEIQAIRWSGYNLREVIDFTGLHPSAEKWTWAVGDYVIRGVKGEFYPCKPDIFWKTYERAR